MLRSLMRTASRLQTGHLPFITNSYYYTTYSGKHTDPLRILFCGSDSFSAEHLQALNEERLHNPDLVESIDVTVLPPKPVGRGLKTVREVPVMKAADTLGLPYHQIANFDGFDLPKDVNLIIAVSFGLFIPGKLIQQCKYGGLNLHPSFLPDLRGPAPIQRAVMRGDTHVGISLQTLHPTRFDHGTILSQTPSPGLPIMRHPNLQRVNRRLAMEGSDVLIQALRAGFHIAPYEDAGWKAATMGGGKLTHAPKSTKQDSQVDWGTWSVDDWHRRLQLNQGVWTVGQSGKGKDRRLIFHDVTQVEAAEVTGRKATMEVVYREASQQGEEGQRSMKTVVVDSRSGALCILLDESTWIKVRRATMEGSKSKKASDAAAPFLVKVEDR